MAEAYIRCAANVHRRLAARQRGTQAAAQQSDDRARADHFCVTRPPVLLAERFVDRPTWRRLKLARRLRHALADADPADVDAIARIGLPGAHCSGSVNALIRKIAADVAAQDREVVWA
jgi:hypothetical protein